MPTLRIAAGALWALGALAQTKITEVKLHVVPPDGRIRPQETAVVQVRVYGSVGERQGRLQYGDFQVGIKEDGGGWLSKPFRFQGQDNETFVDERSNAILNILNRGVGQLTVKDSVLYTAPEKTGKYTIEVVAGTISAQTVIDVTGDAPSQRKPERTSFGPEQRPAEPHRRLAERYAPFIAQETWFQPKSDYLARFDYDGDWDGANNWENLDTGSSQAYVHYAAMETATHWFLIYNFFHPRDYSDNCVVGTCHENDNEGMILTIRKDGSEFGKLEVMETLAHDNVYSYTSDSSIAGGLHNVDGRIDLWEGSHPMIFVEAGGHGVHSAGDQRSTFSVEKKDFARNTGVTYVYRGEAQRPKHAQDRLVGYELLPILDHWWKKSEMGAQWSARTFDDFFTYEPAGGRPRMQKNQVGGAFYGRRHGSNKAKPFWGWHDLRTLKAKVLLRGQWALDPAYAVTRNLRFPPDRPVSLEYTYNPYLDILPAAAATAVASAAPVDPPAPARARVAPAAAAAGGVPAAAEGTCELEARVDGAVVVTIRGDQAEFQEVSGQATQDTSFRCTAPLPGAPVTVQVEKRQGRGSVRLSEIPAPANGFAARLLVDDSRGGSDRYRITIRWKQ